MRPGLRDLPVRADEVVWLTDPPDGVVCLVSTRRVLDANGHCCDYSRCASTTEVLGKVDRCLLWPDHEGQHHGASCRYWL